MDSVQLEELLNSENDQLQKLNNIVLKAIEEEKLISKPTFSLPEKFQQMYSSFRDQTAACLRQAWAIS